MSEKGYLRLTEMGKPTSSGAIPRRRKLAEHTQASNDMWPSASSVSCPDFSTMMNYTVGLNNTASSVLNTATVKALASTILLFFLTPVGEEYN